MLLKIIALTGAMISLAGGKGNTSETFAKPDQMGVSQQETVIWHIKAVHPEGRLIDVKALDGSGNIYDVKALQDTDRRLFLDVKALIGGERIPVKVLVSEDTYAPVKAIAPDGTILDIKALDGSERLDVKGVNRSGNIIDIKAIGKDGSFYGIKAISPEGLVNAVKGIKVSDQDLETTINGIPVHAHIKAILQID